MKHKPISLLVCALGGEGGGVLTDWLVSVAKHAGHAAQATSIPGVAQRTGATTYYIEVFPVPIARLGGRRPVFSLNPVPGALDAMVSSELLETARQIGNGMASRDRTLVITSAARALTTQERVHLGDGRAESEELQAVVREFSREHRIFDMNAIAKECGTVVSSVMLGAIAGSGVFPLSREDYEHVVREGGGSSAQASLRGFARAYELCHAGLDPASSGFEAKDAGLRVEPAMTEVAELGRQRLIDYQGESYAALYEQRLSTIRAVDREPFAITRETARWLALWMAFDDIVRVAQLKSRASRIDRVKHEVKAKDGDLLRVWDHFKPGTAEFAALLPPSLAKRLLARDKSRSWSLPLKLGTHTITGMLALRILAGLKWLRPRSSRYALEQQMIERWLDAIVEGARRDSRLGHEIARCGRLIKGYGTTNERGKNNLLHVIDHLAHLPDPQAAARAIAEARTAALADEAGQALDATLARHGAPPRPVKEQPIRFVRRQVKTTIPQAPR